MSGTAVWGVGGLDFMSFSWGGGWSVDSCVEKGVFVRVDDSAWGYIC
jgi:hypothetical protein